MADSEYDYSDYTGSYLPIDTAGLTASNPNWKGTPTLYSDDKGNVRGVYTSSGVVPVESLNPLVRKGESITASTPVQEVGEGGARMYLRDANDPESKTYENTGIPSIAGTVAQQGFVPQRNKSPFGTIGSDLAAAARDPYFHKFLAAAAAITGGGMALNNIYGVGGLGATATASPIATGGALTGTSLGAPIGSGSLTAGITPSSVAAFEAGLPATMGEIGGLAGVGGAGGVAGLGSMTGQQAMQLARMALPAVGSALGGTKAGGSGQGGQGGQGGTTTQVSATGPWNTFLTPTMIKQDIVEQKPIMDNPELATLYGQLDPYLGSKLAQAGMIPTNLGGGSNIGNVPSANYYSYGSVPQTDLSSYGQSLLGGAPLMAAKGGRISDTDFRKTALGGNTQALFEQAKGLLNPSADVGALAGFKDGGDAHVPEFITGATGHYVKGRGDGQSDDIPAMLADGEYVFDADTVAQLGNGSSDAGAKVLDKMREAIRAHKRSAPDHEIPPKAKSPLEYLKEGMKRK